MIKTFMLRKEDVNRIWYLVDAKDKVLGRLATKVAGILRGKHKPSYTPHIDCGDNVVVINADQIKVTGNKLKDKIYSRYSGYPSGMRQMSLETLLKKNSPQAIRLAVKRMLPITPLGRDMIIKLKIYKNDKFPKLSCEPVKLSV